MCRKITNSITLNRPKCRILLRYIQTREKIKHLQFQTLKFNLHKNDRLTLSLRYPFKNTLITIEMLTVSKNESV